MSEREYYVDHVIDAISEFLSRWAAKGKGLEREDKNGVVHLFNKKRPGLLMFIFVTKDDLSIEMEWDLRALRMEGRDYMEKQAEILVTQLDAARQERQRAESVLVLPDTQVQTAPVSTDDAVKMALSTERLH